MEKINIEESYNKAILFINSNGIDFCSIPQNIQIAVNAIIKTEDKCKELLYYDSKTNLQNELKLKKDIEAIQLHKIIILIKIQGFDEINNYNGYEGGNCIIEKAAKKLDKDFKKLNFKLYHLGGPKFGLLRYCFEEGNIKTLENIDFVNEYIKHFPINTVKGEIHLNLNAGIACHEKANINNAKIALSETKNKSSLIVFNKELENKKKKKSEDTIKWRENVINAINEGKIIPTFQGINNNSSDGKISKFESLVRIKKDGKLISPGKFLNHIKGTHLISEITEIMIKKTIENMVNNNYSFSINLTENDLYNKKIHELIKYQLNAKKIDPNRLIIEILEDENGNDTNFINKINELKNIGVNIAIDDYGTGYSNLKRIIDIEPDFIKIDGSLIKDITDKKSYSSIKAIATLAKDLGIEVIAEYVENGEIQKMVKELGIDYSQGYYFSEPKEKLEI